MESGDLDQGAEPLTTQRMSELYPLFATSLLSLVKNADPAVDRKRFPGDQGDRSPRCGRHKFCPCRG